VGRDLEGERSEAAGSGSEERNMRSEFGGCRERNRGKDGFRLGFGW